MKKLFEVKTELIVNPESINPYEIHYEIIIHEKSFEKRLQNVQQQKYKVTSNIFGVSILLDVRNTHPFYKELVLVGEYPCFVFSNRKIAAKFQSRFELKLNKFLEVETKKYYELLSEKIKEAKISR